MEKYENEWVFSFYTTKRLFKPNTCLSLNYYPFGWFCIKQEFGFLLSPELAV